jgi:predicted component of type VI protein secretion system
MFRLVEAFIHWAAARQAARAVAEHQRGYDWAAGQLLRGDASVEQIEAYVDGPLAFDHITEFDDGARAACMAWGLRP